MGLLYEFRASFLTLLENIGSITYLNKFIKKSWYYVQWMMRSDLIGFQIFIY